MWGTVHRSFAKGGALFYGACLSECPSFFYQDVYKRQEVLYLKYYKKLDSDEIAEVMGLTSRTVYNTTHMAISRLRERLSKSFLLTVAANLWIFN